MKSILTIFVILTLCYPSLVIASNKKQNPTFPRTNCKISLPDSGRYPSSKGKRNKEKVYFIHSESKKDCAQTAKWYEHMFNTVTGSNEPAAYEFQSK